MEGEEDVDGTDGRFELLDGCDCAAANATAPFHGEGDCCNNRINCTCILLLESKERHSAAAAVTMKLDINNIRIDLGFKSILIKL